MASPRDAPPSKTELRCQTLLPHHPPSPPTCIKREHGKVYYLYNKALWRELGRPPKMVQKWLREQEKDTAWGFRVVRGWGWSEGSHEWFDSPLVPKEGEHLGQKEKREG